MFGYFVYKSTREQGEQMVKKCELLVCLKYLRGI